MADPRFTKNATRLSDDMGDVLSAIRRMIADEDVLKARSGARTEEPGLVQDDAAEFLARRYGGNAALARHLVESGHRPAQSINTRESVQSYAPVSLGQPPVPQADAAPAAPTEAPVASAPASGWRSWLRPFTQDPVPVPEPAVPAGAPAALHDVSDDSDDFAEAFDWKARLHPAASPVAPAAEAPRLVLVETLQPELREPSAAETRRSGWVMPQHDAQDAAIEASASDAAASKPRLQTLPQDADIRSLLRELVQNELNGELGARFSANLRVVIRREVAAAIDAHLDRL